MVIKTEYTSSSTDDSWALSIIKKPDKRNSNTVKQILILTTIILFSSASSPLFAQQDSFINDYLERLENSRKYLILVAETMPEDNYDFRASPESLTFAEN